jgi:hypothetical protein
VQLARRDGTVALVARDAETRSLIPDGRRRWRIALACDLRVAVDTAKFTTAFSKIGLAGDMAARISAIPSAPRPGELYFRPTS